MENLYENCIGIERKMNCGKNAKILEYIEDNKVIIVFEDGFRRECDISSFNSGKVQHPSVWINKEKRMHNGLVVRIVEYLSTNHIIVCFEDGVKRKSTMGLFNKGRIPYPGVNAYKSRTCISRLNTTQMMNCGMTAKIIAYNGTTNVVIEFSNGEIGKGSYYAFCTGAIYPESMTSEGLKEVRLNEERIMNCQIKAKIIAYRHSCDVDIRFESGIEKHNVTYCTFSSGGLKHPGIRTHNISLAYILNDTRYYYYQVKGHRYLGTINEILDSLKKDGLLDKDWENQ